jgi:hypothetical protein
MLTLVTFGLMTGPAAAQEFGDYAVRIADEGDAFVLTMGPVDLEAMAHGHGGSHEEIGVFPPIRSVRFPRDAYLSGFSYEVLDAAGQVLPTAIVHHLNFISPDTRELLLPISQRLLAMGKETGSQSLPGWLLGVPVEAGSELVVSPMLHNPTGQAHQGVHVRVRLEYTEAGGAFPFLKVYPFQLDVAFPAGDKSVDLPPGTSAFYWEGSPVLAGRIMAIGSHMHEMATSIRLEDATTGALVWEGLPILGPDGETVEGVTIGKLYRRLGVKIDPEHRYRVTVEYHNPGTETITAGGMGVVAGVFLPAGGAHWPEADVADALYTLDRRHYMREVRGDYDLILDGGGVIEPADMEMGGDEQHEHEGAHMDAPPDDTTRVDPGRSPER